MKKLIFALLAVVFCAACEKEIATEEEQTETPEVNEETLEPIFSMSADELVGTYWHRARFIYLVVTAKGEVYTQDSNDPDWVGYGSEDWYFVDNNRVFVYYDTDYPPFYLYEETTYQYDPEQKKLTIGKLEYDLLQFTPEQFVYTYVESDEAKNTLYFRPFTPSEAWFEDFKDATKVEYK